MFLKAQRSRRRLAAVVLAAALAVAGCGGSGGGGGTAADTLVVYTGQAGDWQLNFNPYSPTRIEGLGTIFEPLFFYNITGSSDPVKRLGESFEWNADGTVLSITTRAGATWTDGKPFTAKDVVFTLDMVAKTPTMNSVGYKGKATAIDDTHLTVTFDEPSYLVGPQVLGRTWIVPEHLWGQLSDPATDVIATPVGTGPFQLDEFKAQAFTLKANEGYHSGAPAVKKIRYLSLSGNQAGADALKAGQVDWQTGPVPDIANVEKNYPGYKANTTPMNQAALLTCSNAALGCEGPQTDPAVRKAVHYALNRTQVNSLAFENTASEISPGFALLGRDDDVISSKLAERTAPMQPDTAKAGQLLEGAGYAKGGDGFYAKDGRQLALNVKVVAGWTDYITALDTMTQQLQQAGIKLNVQQSSWNEWADARGQGKYQLIIDSLYQGPAADPFYLYSYFFATSSTAPVGQTATPNFARVSDPAIDAALDALKAINPEDTAARQPHLDAIQTRVEETVPYIPLLTAGTTSEYNAKKFTGWPDESNPYAFFAVWSAPDNSEIYRTLKPAGQ
ncbi:ABC transporter substrate-binding protein [Actinosynnema pretiosum]|uniref:Peptide ABC transporter substrate-binding protein n=1 Tax=Actinosynnema pretiosum TaxID=42197 RepID=A0A290ZDM9_9PSEU|nr:ABC transporter substrate-binding protein [Actinosynnema pretiosum]ATE57083.1 peptide ABC transporter substrate-binding protein [Actinosynnema pretiosum]